MTFKRKWLHNYQGSSSPHDQGNVRYGTSRVHFFLESLV